MAIDFIADYFGFRENNTNLKTETLAGLTTFMTMSILFLFSRQFWAPREWTKGP